MSLKEAFESKAVCVHYIGLQPLSIVNDKDIMLLYFSLDTDSVDAPLSITSGQAKQLYRDLKKHFKK